MKKNITLFVTLIVNVALYSQVGINTQNPQGIFNIDGGKDNPTTGSAHTAAQQRNDLVFTTNGNLGLGTISPTTKLHIDNGATNGAIRIIDGTQAEGKVLTSDANGVATWQNKGLGTITNTTVEWSSPTAANYAYPTGTVIVIGPFSVPTTGWYRLVSRFFMEQNTNPATGGNATIGTGYYWLQISSDNIVGMDTDILYEYRSVVSTGTSCPPSGSFSYYSAGSNYYIKIFTNHVQSAVTGERTMRWTLVQ